MSDLKVELNPTEKLRLWREIKHLLLDQMDKDIITPERADQILSCIKAEIIKINTPEEVRQFCLKQIEAYPELSTLKKKLETEDAEAFDQLMGLLLNEFMEKDQFELASELLDDVSHAKNQQELTEKLQNKYPVEFKRCLNNFKELSFNKEGKML